MSTKSKRVAENVRQARLPRTIRHVVQIALWIGRLEMPCRRNNLLLQ